MPSLASFLSENQLQFSDTKLLQQALTHRSYGEQHNETLEFVGDAALGLVIADALRQKFPSQSEGELSRLRASLVKGETLAVIANEITLGENLLMGAGELASGGRNRSSILADALEALIGALYLDTGYERMQAGVLALFQDRLDSLILDDSKDGKTLLQEYLQAQKLTLPTYTVERTEGSQHQQTFFVNCKAADVLTHGSGSTKRKAEQMAAAAMLQLLTGTK